MAKKGNRNKKRGNEWEREVANALCEALERDDIRRYTYRESQVGNIGDIDAAGLPISIQCRSAKHPGPSFRKAIQDAKEGASEGEYPIAAIKRRHGRGKRAERYFLMDDETFYWLIKEALGDKE